VACQLAGQRVEQDAVRVAEQGRELERGLLTLPGARLNGHPQGRLRSTINVSFGGVDGEALLASLDLEGVCVSTGSACASGSVQPSHVLLAMGRSAAEARGAVRFSPGRLTTSAEVAHVLQLLPGLLDRIRSA
jgi:cysteine desulfurase